MGESNRFFVWLWRFNAIVLALVALAVLVLLVSNVASLLPQFRAERIPADNFLAAPHAPTEDASYELAGSGTSLAGTSFVIFDLVRTSTSRNALPLSSGGRDRDTNTVNVLVVDGADASSHWLFRGVDRIVWADSSDMFKAITATDDPKSPVVALVIEAVSAHADKAGALKAAGPDDLYYYRVGGEEAVKFFSADDIRSIVEIGADRLLVMYAKGQSVETATFSTRDFRLISQSRVPPVPKR